MTLTASRVPADIIRPTGARVSRPLVIVALVLGALGSTISLIGSWIPSLWGDEVTSVMSAERSIPSLFRMLGHVDAVHGTYYLALHFWIGAFGASPFSVRFPSAIGVGAMIVGLVFLGSRLGGARVGILAATVALVIPRVTYMGEEARSYAWSAAFVVWLTYLLIHLVSGAPKRRRWIFYAVGVAACAYVFLFSLLILAAHAVVILLARDRKVLRTWLKSVLVGLVIAIPVIAWGIGERGQIAFLSARMSTGPRTLFVTQWFGNSAAAIAAWTLIAAALSVAIIGWYRRRSLAVSVAERESYHPTLVPLAATWLLASPVILLVVNAVHPVYSSRYLSFAVPGAALLIGWVLAKIRPRWLVVPLIATLFATSLVSYGSQRTPYSKNNSDWAQVAATVKAHAKAGDGILFDESTRPSRLMRLSMHGYPASYTGLIDIGLDQPWSNTDGWRDTTVSLSEVPTRLDSIDTVWMVEYRGTQTTADTYDIATLHSLGFTEKQRYTEHASEVIRFVRN
ncbi:glycosyltransferase family 39 protein [soil metagenome]